VNAALVTRHGQGSKTTVEGDAKVVAVDYSNKDSVKKALHGVDVVICTIAGTAVDLQAGIAAAAKEAGVKLFVPSEFGNVSEGETKGLFGQKAVTQNQMKAVGIPWAIFYTGPFADFTFSPYVSLLASHISLLWAFVKLTPTPTRQVRGPRCPEWESDHWW